tara:strand:- start:794 stop:1081 length:288 start_codon:yes stop_codon:yes gene_type:complete
MSKITPSDVRKVAKLARLSIAEDQLEMYSEQLEKILNYVAELEKIDTNNVLPTTRAVEVVNMTREDSVQKTNVRENLLNLAPQREGDFYRVPKIL